MSDIILYCPKNPNMSNVTWLVFNCQKNEQRNARARFVRKFGKACFDTTIKPALDNGIMSIFHNRPTAETAFFVNVLAEMVDRRTYPQGFEKSSDTP